MEWQVGRQGRALFSGLLWSSLKILRDSADAMAQAGWQNRCQPPS